jgi:predicted nucleotidyltransferase
MEDDINCRMRLDGLMVDFMPDDENILGYTNRWYKDALRTAENYVLQEYLTIRLVSPVLFVATKLEAYRGRGNNDPLQSRDIEDIINVFDGRPEIMGEIKQAAENLQNYISGELSELLEYSDFEYVVQSAAQGQSDREELIFKRLEAVIDKV